MRASRLRGSIFAVGGREARRGKLTVLGEFISRCGGPGARLVVLSAASREPEKQVAEYGPAFRSLGVGDTEFFHQDSREDGSDPDAMAAVRRADGVFFTGGNQLKLVATLAGTPLDALLRERHRRGLHLGGTSAGASALSSLMIARGKGRSAARLSAVRLSAGLGFLPGVIVDQHFRERDRFGRLLAAVLCNPSLLGFGLDEDTAFAVDPNDRVSVLGGGTLTIVDGRHLEATDVDEMPDEQPVAFAGMRVHVLREGWFYDLTKGTVEKRTRPLVEGRALANRELVALRG